MVTRWRYSLLLLIFSIPFKGYGKKVEKAEDIFEKPTEEKVEASSTFFITPRDVKQNYRTYHRVDRSITKMDRFTITERHNYSLQNLGNNWTAAQHIFYRLPQHIGATYGFSAYDFYFQHPQDIRYYCMPNSRLYTHFNIVLANLGSFVFDGCSSLRLLDNWYIGANLRSAMTENEWPKGKDDKIVSAYPHLDIFTHLKTPGESYHLFTSFSHMKYMTQETGGIRSAKDKFDFKGNPSQRYNTSLKLLEEARMEHRIPIDPSDQRATNSKLSNKDLRRNFYLYHHYEFSEPIQLYHELNYNRKNNSLTVGSKGEWFTFITDDAQHASSTETSYPETSSVTMQSFGNEIGMKGDIEPLRLFYGAYYRVENIDLNYDFPTPNGALKKSKNEREHYLGCKSRLNLTKSGLHKLYLDGEYLFPATVVDYHKFNISYRNNFFALAYHSVQYKVPYIMQYGYSRYRQWHHTPFVAPSAQEITTEVYYDSPYIRIKPTLTFKKIYNHIYYSQLKKDGDDYDHCIAQPIQAKNPVDLLSWGGHLDFCFFSYFHFDHTLTFLNDISNGQKIFKGYMPPYMYTSRYYYAHQPFNKKMDIETGINIHFKDLYYADGYDIIAQQFYRQHLFAVQGRPIIDVFLNFRISNFKFSLKYSYINELMEKPKAYFATPFYPGQKTAADVGVHWSFFD